MVADNRKRLLVLVDLLLKKRSFSEMQTRSVKKWKMNKRQV